MRIGITGHRGLPVDTERSVTAAVREAVSACPATGLVGVSCIADGPDTWFARAVLEHGGSLEIVVPAANYRASLPDWHHAVYDDLVRRASEVHETGLPDSDPHAYMFGSEVLVGMVDELLAVWDGRPARGHGGTADVVTYARRTGVPVRVLWPAGATRD